METESDYSVSHGSSHFHVLENATSLIAISCPPWWKSWYFYYLSYSLPWAGHTEAKQPIPCAGQGCHWSPRAQGAARLQSSTFHMARPGTSQLCWLRPRHSSDKRHLSSNGPATSRDCAVSPTAGVTMTQLLSPTAAGTAIVKLDKQHHWL